MKPIIFDAIDGKCLATKPKTPYARCVTAYQQFIAIGYHQVPNVNEPGVRDYAKQALAQNAILKLDIKLWPANWPIITTAINMARTASPSTRIGYYGSGVVGGNMLMQAVAGNAQVYATDYALTEAGAPTNRLCDYISPACYLRSDQSMSNWGSMAGASVAAARQWGKAVYVEVSPFLEDNNQPVPLANWSAMIWSLFSIVDGLIIAANIDTPWGVVVPWWDALAGLKYC